MLRLRVDGEPYALIEIYDDTAADVRAGRDPPCQALAAEAGKAVSRARMAERLEEAYFSTLGALAAALEARTPTRRTMRSRSPSSPGAVCERLDIPPADARLMRLGALLHDIGKIGIPELILRKPGPLTARESTVMRRHPQIGARILKPVPHFAELVPLVRASHERWDGRAIPRASSRRIPLGSRVIGVCDAFHAMTEDRVYRRRWRRPRRWPRSSAARAPSSTPSAQTRSSRSSERRAGRVSHATALSGWPTGRSRSLI